jgi:hypothetical protein
MYASDKQTRFISFLAKKAGFTSGIAAYQDFSGDVKSISSLTVRDASALIDWLKAGATPRVNEWEVA